MNKLSNFFNVVQEEKYMSISYKICW